MRTTLVLPDDLYREVKATAAVHGRTVTSLVEESLRKLIEDYDHPPMLSSLPVCDAKGGFTADFLASGVDFNDNSAVRDWLDEVEGRPL